MVLFFCFLIAMFVTMALIPPLMRVAERLQIVDLPNDRKVHLQAIPRVGGTAMLGVWSLPQMTGLLSAMAVILGFGVWDDRADLDYRLKFAGQCVAAVIVWWVGVRVTELHWVGEISTLASLAVAVMGSILGFLRVNTHPARVFMGDGGSQFLGFAVGVLVILLTQGSEHSYSVCLPVLLLGLPIL